MKRTCLLAFAAGALLILFSTRPAQAQGATGCGVRAVVADEEGKPLPDVDVEIQYQGEGPKRVFHQKTNKKGGFVRIGMPDGPYKIILSKEGYQKYAIEKFFGLGEVADLCSNVNPVPGEPCKDLLLKKAQVTTVIQGAPGAGAGGAAKAPADAAAAKAASEEAAKLGATYQQAVEAIKGQQWDAAEVALKEVLDKVPNQPAVLYNLGHVYVQKKDYPNAEARFRQAIEADPAKPEPYIALASLLEEEKKGDEAVDLLLKASASFQQDAKFQTALGATAMNAARDKEAEEAFTRVLALDPSKVQVEYFLSTLALNRNDVPGAIAHLEKFVAGAPPDSPDVAVAKTLLTTLQAKAKAKKK